MFISMIVTVFNNEKYLERCLDSVMAQDFDDYEVIIVDEGSGDGSARICDEFCKKANTAKADKVKVIHMEHAGHGEAANRGLDEARGEWIWFVDSRDLVMPGSVRALKERMRMAKGELYISQLINVDKNGDTPRYDILRENQEEVRIKNDGDLRWHYSDRILAGKECLLPGIRLFNGDLIRNNKLRFPESGKTISEDTCFLMKYMMFVSREVLLVNGFYCLRNINGRTDNKDETILIPRMIALLEEVYSEAERFEKKQVLKDYYIVCLSALKNLIQNKLDEISDDRICEMIIEGCRSRVIGKHIKKVRKELLSAARADRIRK